MARVMSRFASYTTRVGSIVTPYATSESATCDSSRARVSGLWSASTHTWPAARNRAFSSLKS